MHCGAFLPFVIENNLGLAQLALKLHVFSACVNGVSQLSFRVNRNLSLSLNKWPNIPCEVLTKHCKIDFIGRLVNGDTQSVNGGVSSSVFLNRCAATHKCAVEFF